MILSVQPEWPVIIPENEVAIHVGLTISGVTEEHERQAKHTNTAILLDVSTSMEEGDKLKVARESVRSYLDVLNEKDLLTVLAFGGGVTTLCHNLKPTPENKSSLLKSIQGIAPQPGTPLFGVLSDAESLAEQDSENLPGSFVSRVLLVTDGQATDVEDSEKYKILASNLRTKGVTIVTIGIGKDYDEDTLMALYKANEGLFKPINDLNLIHELPEYFSKLAKDARNVLVSSPILKMSLSEGATIEKIYRYKPQINEIPQEKIDDRNVKVRLGDLVEGESQEIYVKIKVPARKEGTFREAAITVSNGASKTENFVVTRSADENLRQSRRNPLPRIRFKEAQDKVWVTDVLNRRDEKSGATLPILKDRVTQLINNPEEMSQLGPEHIDLLKQTVNIAEKGGNAKETKDVKAKATVPLGELK